MIAFFVGLLVVFAAAGGVENSVSDAQLIQSILLTFPGLALMYVGANQINEG